MLSANNYDGKGEFNFGIWITGKKSKNVFAMQQRKQFT